MLVQWDPENGEDKQEWTFDPGDVLRKDAKLIQTHSNMTWDQWRSALLLGDVEARTVLLWYMMKLVHPSLKFTDVPDFKVRQLKVEMGVIEITELIERVRKAKLSPDQREAFESQIEIDLRDAMKREGIDGDASIVDGQIAIEGGELPKG